jgi:hypothetical protein
VAGSRQHETSAGCWVGSARSVLQWHSPRVDSRVVDVLRGSGGGGHLPLLEVEVLVPNRGPLAPCYSEQEPALIPQHSERRRRWMNSGCFDVALTQWSNLRCHLSQ